MAINLLSDIGKKELSLEATKKKILVVLFFALLSAILFLTILMLINKYIDGKKLNIERKISQKQEDLKKVQLQNLSDTILETNKGLTQIRNFWQKQVKMTPAIEKLSKIVPQSIYFSHLAFSQDKIGPKIDISGEAQTRGALFYFKQNLELEPSFSEVSFAPSSWVKPTEVAFGFNLRYKATVAPK